MSAAACWTALQRKLKAINGIKAVVLGEPTSYQDAPLISVAYQELDRFLHNHPPARNLTGDTHTFAVRLVIRWTDNTAAEEEVLRFVESIPNALDANPQLDSTITSGLATISSALTGFLVVGSTTYRIVEFTCQVIEKRRVS